VPSSTAEAPGESETLMSLEIVAVAAADFVVSAWLVAVTCTFAFAGKSVGALYTPLAEMVPDAAEPPATPFTLQVTVWLEALETVAEKGTVFPRRTVADRGLTATLMDGGGGGGA